MASTSTTPNLQDRLDAAALLTADTFLRLVLPPHDLSRSEAVARIARDTGTSADHVEAMLTRARMVVDAMPLPDDV